MNSVLRAVKRRSFPGRGILVCLFAGLALAGLSGCSGSSESTLQPVTLEPVVSQPGEGDADEGAAGVTEADSPSEELDVFETLNFLGFASRAMGTDIPSIVPREAYEIGGTGCQGKSFDYRVREMDGNATHFAVTPTGERIAGSTEGAIEAVWSSCYASQGIEITSDQLVQLVVNFGDVRFARAEDESTMSALRRHSVDYEPPTLVQDGDNFTFTVLVYSDEFGDIYRAHVERTSEDLTVDYEELYRN